MQRIISWLRPTRPELVDALAAAGLVLVALVGFRSSYGGAEFMVVGMIGVVLGLVVAHLLVRAKLPVLVAAAVLAVVYLVVGGVVALRDRAIAGFIPSGDTIVGAARTAVFGWKELITTNPPVGGTGTLMMLPFLCGFGGVAIGSLLMRNRRLYAAAIVPALIVLGVSVVTGVQQPVAPLVQGGLFGAIAIAWMAVRQDRIRPRLAGHRFNVNRFATGTAMLGLCTAAGWYAAPSLPRADATERTVWRETVTPPFDPREYPSPLSAYRHYVKGAKAKDSVMFTIEGLPQGVKVRLATMDTYDGLVWRPSFSEDTPTTLNSGYFERMGSEIAADYGGETAEITVTIGAYNDVWIPDVGEVVSLRFEGGPRDERLNEALRYNRATDTAASRVPLQAGDRYVMTVRLPTNLDKLEKLEISPGVPVGAANGMPTEMVKWAGTPGLLSISDIGTRIDTLRARLIAEGAYSDGDRTQGQAPSDAGHSAYRMASFLEHTPMRGNAEQYASALALMLRGLNNVSSRVVMGFEPDPAVYEGNDSPAIDVTGAQVEAWVEVPVEGIGWVAVVPTPERSETALKAKSPSPPEPDYETQVPPPPPLVDPEFDAPATSKTGAEDTRKPEADKPVDDADRDGAAGTAGGGVGAITVGLVGSPILLIAVLIIAILLLKMRRRRRRRTIGVAHARMANGWAELTDNALDMGRPIPPTSTRREVAQFIGPGATALAERADRAVFSTGEPTDDEVEHYWAELASQLKSMRSELGPIDRVKAALSVTSLRHGRDARRLAKRARLKKS